MEQFVEKQKTSSGLSTATLVLGIISVVVSLIPIVNFLTYLLVPIGTICGIVALIKKQNLVKSIVGIILCVVSIFIPVIVAGSIVESIL